MKVIKRTTNLQEAKIIVSYLKANGVNAQLPDGNISDVLTIPVDLGLYGGVRITVPDNEEAQALRLLAEADAAQE